MLQQLLEKLGIQSFDSLTAAERETYQQWATTLQTKDVTIDDLRSFFDAETERANAELRNIENREKKQLYYQMYASFLMNARAFIFTPVQQRDQLKARLKQQFGIDA